MIIYYYNIRKKRNLQNADRSNPTIRENNHLTDSILASYAKLETLKRVSTNDFP